MGLGWGWETGFAGEDGGFFHFETRLAGCRFWNFFLGEAHGMQCYGNGICVFDRFFFPTDFLHHSEGGAEDEQI